MIEGMTSPQSFGTRKSGNLDVNREIKQAVRDFMASAELGQARCALKIGIGAGAINNLLRGRKPTLATVRHLDEFFGKCGRWIAAFELARLPKRKKTLSLRDIRVYPLAKYGKVKQ